MYKLAQVDLGIEGARICTRDGYVLAIICTRDEYVPARIRTRAYLKHLGLPKMLLVYDQILAYGA